MLLKRIYKTVTEGGNPKILDYLALAHTGTSLNQNFSTRLVTDFMTSGVISIEGDVLILDLRPEPLRYAILRRPGRYCLSCGEKLADDEGGALARLHVAEKHDGLAAYEQINHFECALDARQHEKYRVRNKARAPKFHTRKNGEQS